MSTQRMFLRSALTLLGCIGVLALFPVLAQGQTFVLKWGSFGAGISQFNDPAALAVDASGNVYVSDNGNHRVQKFTSSGGFLAQWGSYGSGPGQFSSPTGIAVDASGNVYVADWGNNRVQKFTSSGSFLAQWGSFGIGDGQFASPTGIAVDASGNVYVTDTDNYRVQKFTSSGGFLAQWGSGGYDDGQFYVPWGIAVDAAGNVYVADWALSRVQKFTSSGGLLTQWATQSPIGIAVDASGNVYVTDPDNRRVQKFTSSGGFLTQWGSAGSGDGQFVSPIGIAVDASGNVYVSDNGNNRVQKFSQQVNKANTATTVTSSVNPSVFGQSVTFTATVTSGAGTPTGTVTFKESANTLGTATLNASGQASFNTSGLSVGNHTVTAEYGGSSNFNSSSGSVAQTVNKANTATTVTSSVNPSVFGQSVTFTATVTSGAGAPTGTVTFKEGANTLGTATLNASGQASFNTSSLSGGNHTVTAEYDGSGNFNSSSGSVAQTVNKANTVTTVSSSVNLSVFGQSVTFTATVSAVAGGAGAPTGTVTFKEGANTLGTATLDGSGQASFSTSSLSVGNHTVTAEYGGSGNFNSSSGSDPMAVNKANTATTVTSSVNPSVFGQSVTFTATVSAVAPGAGTPTGTVTFKEGANTLGTESLDGSGQASFNTSGLSGGNHTVTAEYGGSGNFNSSSGSVAQTVNKALTQTSATASPSSSIFGQSVTFTATVTSDGSPVTEGAVTFKEGSTILADPTVLDTNGQASFSTSSLSGGSHTITAEYSGSGSFALSSNSVIVKVNRPPVADAGLDQTVECASHTGTSVTLDGSKSSDPDGDSLTYTWREGSSIIAGPGASPTSQVTLSLGSHTITLTVDDGKGGMAKDDVAVIVRDTTPPKLTVPDNVTVECSAHGGQAVDIGKATATDVCDPSPVVASDAPAKFSLGVTTVTWTATDSKGNKATATQTVTVQDTPPPVLTVPANVTVECSAHDGQAVSIGTATATDICDPSPVVTNDAPLLFKLGITTVTWTAADASGNQVTATQTVTVVDTTPPVLTVPANVTVECSAHDGQAVDIGQATATDVCDPSPQVTNNAPALFKLGKTVVTWTATDHSGNSTSADQIVMVADTTPPVISLTVNPNDLWPPNHKMVKVSSGISAADVCDPAPVVSVQVTSNEPVNGLGDGDTAPDWEVVKAGNGTYEVSVRAERSGKGSGRIYTITVTATDASGNVATSTATVTVGHDQGKKAKVGLAKVGESDAQMPEVVPEAFGLDSNYPNPFNPATTIRYALPEGANVRLVIYNILGQEVKTLVDASQAAGRYSVVWDGRDEAGRVAATGVYIYRLQAGAFTQVKKMLFAK